MGTIRIEQPSAKLRLQTSRFGEIELSASEIITFPEGILGFAQFRRYVLIKEPEQEPFLWLQGVDDPTLAFVVVDPFLFFPGYEIQVKPHELSSILMSDIAKATVLIVITIPEDAMSLTGNLRGPIVINSENNFAKQLVLIDDRFNTKHYLLKDIPDYLAFSQVAEPVPPVSNNPRKG